MEGSRELLAIQEWSSPKLSDIRLTCSQGSPSEQLGLVGGCVPELKARGSDLQFWDGVPG